MACRKVTGLVKRVRCIWRVFSGAEADAAREDLHDSTVRLRVATERLSERTRGMHDDDAARRALDKLHAAGEALREHRGTR